MCVKSIPLTCLGLLLGLMLAGPASAQDAVQDPDLLGWWKLDESSGNLALDSSGTLCVRISETIPCH